MQRWGLVDDAIQNVVVCLHGFAGIRLGEELQQQSGGGKAKPASAHPGADLCSGFVVRVAFLLADDEEMRLLGFRHHILHTWRQRAAAHKGLQ